MKSESMVPKLRFPEFLDEPEWEEKKLEPFLEAYSERVPATTDLSVYSSTGEGLKLQKDYYDGRELINEGEYGVVPKDYFVYRHMSNDTVFNFNINNTSNSIVVSKEYPVFRTVNLNSQFLLYMLNSGADFQKFVKIQKKGGTRTILYFKTLCSWETLLPSPKEQHKIADCLTSLDDLISAHTDKLERLKEHKKGVIQQLFPKEGKTVPEFCASGDGDENEQEKIAEVLTSLDKLIIAQSDKTETLKLHKKGLMQQLFPLAEEVNR